MMEDNNLDTLLLPTGDWHTGSTTALHPNVAIDKDGQYKNLTDLGGWKYTDNPNFYPSALQIRIWEHFEKCLDNVVMQAENKKLFILKMGDEIDGDHHNSTELVTRHIVEQTNTNIELMKYAKKRLGFKRGDTLAYLQGTQVHVGIQEQEIARQMGGVEYSDGRYVAPMMDEVINGVRVWAYHKGVTAGQGQTRGNACINKMRQVYYQCLQDGDPIPDVIISAHTHDPHSATWTRPDGKIMNYLITAPWQDKTRFAFDNLATNKNKVGMQTITITDGGQVIVNPPMLLSTPRGNSIRL